VHGCWDIVDILTQQSDDQHMLAGVYLLMFLGAPVEIGLITYRKLKSGWKRRDGHPSRQSKQEQDKEKDTPGHLSPP
jgi:hypothetical protein